VGRYGSTVGAIIGIQAAVTERTASGQPFAPSQALTVEEALASYTKNAAFAAFDDQLDDGAAQLLITASRVPQAAASDHRM
jgi:predicted amidohydrolase YtcJ